MPGYAGIYVDIPKSACMYFALYAPIVILCLLEHVVTNFNAYFSLKGHEAVFLKRQNFSFSIVAGRRLNVFTSKILN